MIYLTTNIAGLNRHHTLHLVIDRFEAPKATTCYGCNTESSLRWRCSVFHRADPLFRGLKNESLEGSTFFQILLLPYTIGYPEAVKQFREQEAQSSSRLMMYGR